MTVKRKIPLYVKILIGMVLGMVWGLSAESLGLVDFTTNWIKPWGDIFISSLKLIAVPLIIFSLIDGISNLSDISRLSSMGGKTIGLYIGTTIVAITIALIAVNAFKPGESLPAEKQLELKEQFAKETGEKIEKAHEEKGKGPLQPIVDIVPDNIFVSVSDNGKMLQVIFFAILFGVAMVLSKKEKIGTVKSFFDGCNTVILSIVEIIMKCAPVAVFALLASLNIDGDLLSALAKYAGTVIAALAVMMFVVYPLLLVSFTKLTYRQFMRGILPAQILAFSTSSSAATLPVTMDCVEKNLGVSEEVTGFVLPLGATINMDGTSIHQAVSAVFIAQAFGIDLTLGQQVTILLTAVLSSIGAAAVPGAGIIMLIIVLEAIGVDPEGTALILAVDRPLDMLRTTVNITGDSAVAAIIAGSEKKLDPPSPESTDLIA